MKLPWDTQRAKDRAEGKYVRDADCPYYNTARWHKISRVWRSQHPLCAECLKNGKFTEGEVTDHIVPWPICKDYFFDESNFQTLCQKCNHDKGQRDKKLIQQWRSSCKEQTI